MLDSLDEMENDPAYDVPATCPNSSYPFSKWMDDYAHRSPPAWNHQDLPEKVNWKHLHRVRLRDWAQNHSQTARWKTEFVQPPADHVWKLHWGSDSKC